MPHHLEIQVPSQEDGSEQKTASNHRRTPETQRKQRRKPSRKLRTRTKIIMQTIRKSTSQLASFRFQVVRYPKGLKQQKHQAQTQKM